MSDAEPTAGRGSHPRGWLVALAGVTLLAAAVRLVGLSQVPLNPYYDAAVRSMGLSLHNFFFGAFDPSASASIDKPPLDLWLQVITVKLLGFNATSLKLPSAIGGTLAVPLLYDLVRRLAGPAAGLVSALTLAVLPAAVVTARSDTMDSVMMTLLVGCAWLLLRYVERRQTKWLLLAALVLGIDFNVKLFEALVPVPAFLVFAWFCWRGEPVGERLLRIGVATAVFAAVALSWLVAVSLAPARDRPFPIGSTNGSVWNAVFVYNGTDRLTRPPRPSTFDKAASATTAATPANAATAHNAASTTGAPPAQRTPGVHRVARKHRAVRAPSAPAGPLRLFRRSLVDFGGLIGTVLFAALVFGGLALAVCGRQLLRAPPPDAPRAAVIRRAATIGLGVWLLTGLVLFSLAGRVHPRYLEAFTPAVAATVGIAVWTLAERWKLLLGGLGLVLVETAAVVGTGTLVRAGLAVGVLVGLAALVLALRGPAVPAAVLPLAVVVSLLGFPVARDISLIRDHSGVQAASPALKASVVAALSRYLRPHQGAARYELAASAPSLAAPVVVRDARPILLLTTIDARPLVTLAALQRAIAARQVSYVLMHGRCPHPPYHLLPQCSAAVEWVQAHGTDVTASLGVTPRSGLLYRVS